MVVQDLRSTYRSTNPEVYTNVPLSIKSDAFENVLPQIGDKKNWLICH